MLTSYLIVCSIIQIERTTDINFLRLLFTSISQNETQPKPDPNPIRIRIWSAHTHDMNTVTQFPRSRATNTDTRSLCVSLPMATIGTQCRWPRPPQPAAPRGTNCWSFRAEGNRCYLAKWSRRPPAHKYDTWRRAQWAVLLWACREVRIR